MLTAPIHRTHICCETDTQEPVTLPQHLFEIDHHVPNHSVQPPPMTFSYAVHLDHLRDRIYGALRGCFSKRISICFDAWLVLGFKPLISTRHELLIPFNPTMLLLYLISAERIILDCPGKSVNIHSQSPSSLRIEWGTRLWLPHRMRVENLSFLIWGIRAFFDQFSQRLGRKLNDERRIQTFLTSRYQVSYSIENSTFTAKNRHGNFVDYCRWTKAMRINQRVTKGLTRKN